MYICIYICIYIYVYIYITGPPSFFLVKFGYIYNIHTYIPESNRGHNLRSHGAEFRNTSDDGFLLLEWLTPEKSCET